MHSPSNITFHRRIRSRRNSSANLSPFPQAIRKKIESELARKRTISTTQNQSGRGKRGNKAAVAKGTVAALKPSPALTVPENITVSEASQLCAAKRTDCVLVVDDEEGLSGIFTAKDLAFRACVFYLVDFLLGSSSFGQVTADGLDPHTTPVGQIMTRSPMVTRDTTSATEALQLMVQKHFRHLVSATQYPIIIVILIDSSPFVTRKEMSSVSWISPKSSTKPSAKSNEVLPPQKSSTAHSLASKPNLAEICLQIHKQQRCSLMSMPFVKRRPFPT